MTLELHWQAETVNFKLVFSPLDLTFWCSTNAIWLMWDTGKISFHEKNVEIRYLGNKLKTIITIKESRIFYGQIVKDKRNWR